MMQLRPRTLAQRRTRAPLPPSRSRGVRRPADTPLAGTIAPVCEDDLTALARKRAAADWSGQVFAKTLTGKVITIDTAGSDPVEHVREKISVKEGIPVDLQRLLFAGRPLLDGRTLGDYGVGAQSTLHIVMLMSGD